MLLEMFLSVKGRALSYAVFEIHPLLLALHPDAIVSATFFTFQSGPAT